MSCKIFYFNTIILFIWFDTLIHTAIKTPTYPSPGEYYNAVLAKQNLNIVKESHKMPSQYNSCCDKNKFPNNKVLY